MLSIFLLWTIEPVSERSIERKVAGRSLELADAGIFKSEVATGSQVRETAGSHRRPLVPRCVPHGVIAARGSNWRPAVAPIRCAFVSVGDAQHGGFVERPARDLQADRQTRGAEPIANADRRAAGDIERRGE